MLAERNFERITIALIAALFFLGGCADWRQTTRVSLTIATQAAKSAETEAVKHFDRKCSPMAEAITDQEIDCAGVEPPKVCKDLEDCLNDMKMASQAFATFYQTVKVALIAVTLGDKNSALEYTQKAFEMVKHLYKILQTFLPDKLPSLPFLEPTTPASQPTK